jgi:hypothetical protein
MRTRKGVTIYSAAAERPRRQLFGYRLRDGIEKTS